MMMLIRHAAIRAVLSGSERMVLDELHLARALPSMEAIDHVDDDL